MIKKSGCSSCGRGRDLHLVIVNFDNSRDKIDGRLLIYCDRCRDGPFKIGLSIPIDEVDRKVVKAIYRRDFSGSEPETFVSLILGMDDPSLIHDLELIMKTVADDNSLLKPYKT